MELPEIFRSSYSDRPNRSGIKVGRSRLEANLPDNRGSISLDDIGKKRFRSACRWFDDYLDESYSKVVSRDKSGFLNSAKLLLHSLDELLSIVGEKLSTTESEKWSLLIGTFRGQLPLAAREVKDHSTASRAKSFLDSVRKSANKLRKRVNYEQ